MEEVNKSEKKVNLEDGNSLNPRIELIQQLIPLGLEAIEDILQEEVCQLAGLPYSRGSSHYRWGINPGSAFLGDQKVSIDVPRVRNKQSGEEVPLANYQALQNKGTIVDQALNNVLLGLSQRKYSQAALSVPETFGISKSSVSRHFIEASSEKLKEFNERDLSHHEFVSIVIDGKQFGGNQIIIALGITVRGEKIFLGLTESHTENGAVCKEFLSRLQTRGIPLDRDYLFVIDGAKGLKKGIVDVFGQHVAIQRCQWHKMRNILSYLSEEHQVVYKPRIQAALINPSYDEAKQGLTLVKKELKLINASAMKSLEEGMEECLMLQKLKVFEYVGNSLKTTNCIESVNANLQRMTGRVTRWKNSDQRQRWVATALLEMEPRMNKIRGHKHLHQLKSALITYKNKQNTKQDVA